MVVWLKKQLIHILPVFLFFLVSFSWINISVCLLLERAGYSPFTFVEIAIAALLVTKILLVLDNLPFTNLFRDKPLIYTIAWKTILYWAITLVVRMAVRATPYLLKGEFDEFFFVMRWPLFVTVQAFYFTLFFIFVTGRELTSAIGPQKMRKILFRK
jgi:hypothetical protein